MESFEITIPSAHGGAFQFEGGNIGLEVSDIQKCGVQYSTYNFIVCVHLSANT